MTYADYLVFSNWCRVSYVVEQRLQLNINIEVVLKNSLRLMLVEINPVIEYWPIFLHDVH